MVAKVIPLKGNIFFLTPGEEIHQRMAYDGLSREDKEFLAFRLIFGEENGFTVKRDSHQDAHVIDSCPPVVLPTGTRIEPITGRQMEDELRVQQKPSLKEK